MTKSKKPTNGFKPGVSGNPAGKPAGTRNKATAMVLSLMEGSAEEITRTILEAARAGDLTAAKLVLERLAPPMRERPVHLALPDTSTAKGCADAANAVLQAVSAGDILMGEAVALAGIVESRRRSIETLELESRITSLEQANT